jgi:division protein CdvB (Snf7/Vps24/ESCRT-III family)
VQGRFQSLAESAGLNSSQLGDIKEQMRAAVENARGDDGAIDRAALKEAASGILKDNGIDPEQLRSKLQGMFQQAGFSPAARLQGSPVGGEAGTARQDLLNEMYAEGAEASGNTVSLFQLLENLPKGSLVNTAA